VLSELELALSLRRRSGAARAQARVEELLRAARSLASLPKARARARASAGAR